MADHFDFIDPQSEQESTAVVKLPGMHKYTDVTLKRGVVSADADASGPDGFAADEQGGTEGLLLPAVQGCDSSCDERAVEPEGSGAIIDGTSNTVDGRLLTADDFKTDQDYLPEAEMHDTTGTFPAIEYDFF